MTEPGRPIVAVSGFYPGEWQTPDRFPLWRSGELHVYWMKIDRSQAQIFLSTLSTDEVKRAGKFRRAGDREDFIVCRGTLRSLLGKYLGIEPVNVQISYSVDGKLFLDHHSANIKFNISHSHEYALFALSNGIEIGVDLERIDASVIDSGMLSHCLHARETEMFHAHAADKKAYFFFNRWTGKEAYLKLRGNGFAQSPSEIDLGPIGVNELYSDDLDVHFSQLPTINGYAAVLATKVRPECLACYKLGSSTFI